ncbi:MAG: hypothetical protein U0271_20490 [Polyangiaceae bacterium]
MSSLSSFARPRALGFIVLFASLNAGCGAKVVFSEDGDGNGGAGGAGTGATGAEGPGPGPGSTTTNTTTNTTGPGSTVSTGPGTLCDQLCAQFEQCVGPTCLDDCSTIYVPGCEAQADAYLGCILQFLTPQCDLPPDACFAESQNWDACANGGSCTTQECSQGMNGCNCIGECNGQKIQEQCTVGGPPPPGGEPPPPGGPPPPQVFCDCFENGGYIGSCNQFNLDCSLEGGCCKDLL